MLDVVLCIETRIYRQGLCSLLEACDGIGDVSACTDLRRLGAVVGSSRSQVIVIDCSLESSESTLAARVREAASVGRGRPVIAIGLDESEDEVLKLAEAGAAAFVTKNDSIDDLVDAMRAAVTGELHCAPRVARRMQERLVVLSAQRDQASRLDKLSRREHHVLGLVERNMSNKQIARELELEVSTIKNHVHSIIVKLSVTSRAEAATLFRSLRGFEVAPRGE